MENIPSTPQTGATDRAPRYSSALIGSLAVITAYTLVRSCVYHFLPATSRDAWFFRDTLMTVPRLGAFAALVLLNRFWQVARFDLPLKDLRRAALFGYAPMALWIFYFSGGRGETFTPFEMLVGFFTSLVVGMYEEYAFRGPLLFALCQRFSLPATIAISSILFTISHIQAQSFRSWGAIFLTGVIFANLRFRGLSLGWLALIHGVTDAFYFVFPNTTPGMFSFHGWILQGSLLACAVITFPYWLAKRAGLNRLIGWRS